MPNVASTYGARLAWAKAQLGKSRKDPAGRLWTPSTTVDDCALFMSAVVFGANAQTCWNVDGFKTVSGGTYHKGKGGLSAGDVVLFDWDGNGVGNHTEMCVIPPDAAGNFHTIGANGSDTIAVGNRLRNAYVLGYFRPNWPTELTNTVKAVTQPEPETTEKDEPVHLITTEHGVYLNNYGTIVALGAAQLDKARDNKLPIVNLLDVTVQKLIAAQ